jgi:fatty-acyl-CoA synthase
MVIVSPIFHGTGLATYMVGATLGNKVVTTRRFQPERTLQLIADHEADMLVAVPTMLHRMVELARTIASRTPALEVSSDAQPAVAADSSCPSCRTPSGDVSTTSTPSTECGFATIATPDELRSAPGTAGRSPVGCEVALFDEHDRRIDGADKRGRIFIRSGARFEGYTDGRNKQVIEGFMSSGDMGHFDENGLLFVDGRDDDMIVSGGENVFPQEVENLLVERDDVSDAAVVGVDDVDFGKRLRAFVVLRPGARQDAEEIKLYVKDNLARHKVPRDVVFIDELPRNATGKLLRRALIEMAVDG